MLFSCRGEVLVSKFGRSSKPTPRIFVLVRQPPVLSSVLTIQTNRHIYIVAQNLMNNQLVISSERTIPIGAIKSISTSTLKDDWFSLVVGSPQEPDPLLNCVFKTEFFTHLSNALRGLNLKIADSYVCPTITVHS